MAIQIQLITKGGWLLEPVSEMSSPLLTPVPRRQRGWAAPYRHARALQLYGSFSKAALIPVKFKVMIAWVKEEGCSPGGYSMAENTLEPSGSWGPGCRL